MPIDPVTISVLTPALIQAGGSLLSGLGGGIMQSQRERDALRRKIELEKGQSLAEIAQTEAAGKRTALQGLIEAYRSALAGR